jgi:uncharacterized Zn finger protein
MPEGRKMKCKRCGREMKREKTQSHTFIYRCSKCGLIIKGQNDKNDYEEAYKIVTGQKE